MNNPQRRYPREAKVVKRVACGIVSMSGFGSNAVKAGLLSGLNVEIRSLNSRYFDCSVRVPSQFSGALESKIKELLEAQLQRGRVEVTITFAHGNKESPAIHFDEKLFAESFATLKRNKKIASLVSDAELVNILITRQQIFDFKTTSNGKFLLEFGPEAALWSKLENALAKAVEQLVNMRVREGDRLATDIAGRLSELEGVRARVVQLVRGQPEKLRAELAGKLNGILKKEGHDPQRLEQELALLATRTDVHEELTRLASHIAEFRRLMKLAATGKRLDFLTQEFLRELNTIGSKVGLAAAQHEVVAGKGIVERIKEQVQNIV